MKKAIFLSYSLGKSSISDYYTALAENLKEEYTVVVFSDVRINKAGAISDDIIVKYWPSKRPAKIADGIFLFKNIRKYKPIMTISVFGSVNIFLIIGFLCRVKARIAWISTLSTQFEQKKILVFRKSLVYKLATNIISNSKATKLDVIKTYKVAEEKIKVLPNSVKNFYSEISNNESEFQLISYVGRLHKSKGVEVLIRAFYKIHFQFSNIRLIIIGGGEEEEFLKELVSELKINDFVFFKGNQTKINVLESFKKSYLAVIPSVSEAFGFTVIEAMSMKTLVIGANNTGIKEIIQNNKTGLLFETNNIENLAEKMSEMLKNPDKRDRLALDGFNHFLKNYETKYAIERDRVFFDSVIKKTNG